MIRPLAAAAAVLVGCTGPLPVADPAAALADPTLSGRKHLGAMVALDANPTEQAYLDALHEVIWRPGYTRGVREAAFERLLEHDEQGLERTIRQRLPRMSARAWHDRLCGLIADHGWVDLTPALVSSWARVVGYVDDLQRAEYRALARLHGEAGVVDAVFDVLISHTRPHEQGLRSRAWELLHRLGHRSRLMALLAAAPPPEDDVMLADLRAGVVELGVLPRTGEEILWLRKLRQPQRAAFWSQAASVAATVPDERRLDLQLRDLPVLVAASVHDPPLLDASVEALYRRVEDHVRSQQHHVDTGRFTGYPGTYGQRLHQHRERLTWGDLAAMVLAIRALEVPQVRAHLFDYAERDRADRSCEYGGVVRLDDLGRFEILEFPPRFRRRDNEFIASQEMLDAAYTSLFHFHLHAQRHRNARYAGPGIGDVNYAQNLRANCLVLTFVNEHTLNVDFYRHDRVIVDLGEVRAPATEASGGR